MRGGREGGHSTWPWTPSQESLPILAASADSRVPPLGCCWPPKSRHLKDGIFSARTVLRKLSPPSGQSTVGLPTVTSCPRNTDIHRARASTQRSNCAQERKFVRLQHLLHSRTLSRCTWTNAEDFYPACCPQYSLITAEQRNRSRKRKPSHNTGKKQRAHKRPSGDS